MSRRIGGSGIRMERNGDQRKTRRKWKWNWNGEKETGTNDDSAKEHVGMLGCEKRKEAERAGKK